jgi:hypothetical protein
MQDMRGCGTNPVFRLLIDRHSGNQLAGSDMFQFPVKVQIHQADKLQIALTPVSQYQSDETDKLPRRLTVTIGSRTGQCQFLLHCDDRIFKCFAQTGLGTETVRQHQEFLIYPVFHTFFLRVFNHRFRITH